MAAGSVYTGILPVNNISTCIWLTEFQIYKTEKGIDTHFDYETVLFEEFLFLNFNLYQYGNG